MLATQELPLSFLKTIEVIFGFTIQQLSGSDIALFLSSWMASARTGLIVDLTDLASDYSVRTTEVDPESAEERELEDEEESLQHGSTIVMDIAAVAGHAGVQAAAEHEGEEADTLLDWINRDDTENEDHNFKVLKKEVLRDMRASSRSRSPYRPQHKNDHLAASGAMLSSPFDNHTIAKAQIKRELGKLSSCNGAINSQHSLDSFVEQLDLSDEELFWQCQAEIDSLLNNLLFRDLDFYIGVTESPLARFFGEGRDYVGHRAKYHVMILLGCSQSGRGIADVERQLIGWYGPHQFCRNKGNGGEHISALDRARFLYICFA